MRIVEKELEHGAVIELKTPVTAKYMQLIQLRHTDAAYVGLRVRHLPSFMGVDDAGNPNYVRLQVGDRIPLPLTDDADGPQSLFCEVTIPYGPSVYGNPEVVPYSSTRAVFAFAERIDGSDLWLPHQRWSDVEQHWVLPAVDGADLAVNEPATGDYDEKNWANLPCKGFVSGVIELEGDTADTYGYCVAAIEYGENNAPIHAIPLFIVCSGDNSLSMVPRVSVPFWLTGTGKRLLFRAWRFTTGTATSVPAARVRLMAKKTAGPSLGATGFTYDLGAAGATYMAACINASPHEPLPFRAVVRGNNDAGSATTINLNVRGYMNAGMVGNNDKHLYITGAASGALAAGASGGASLASQPIHAAVAVLIPGAAAACEMSAGMSFVPS